ncbi:prominin-1-A-like [Spea bombifrons]|uniref:prominin-1-A-like n=1 Tax=Spea bombifrons TaxID=233779 RepID=UPI002349C522|nr:prominin-1-A-like [Spea bombifrons]
MEFQNVTKPQYDLVAVPESGGAKVFNDMVHSYLDLVQPNKFPSEILQKAIKKSEYDPKEILTYEVGFLVAVAIGLVFIILMILVGLFFPCCRCCGNCGGKMYQKQTKRINCKRRFLYVFLFVITLIILAGNICAFFSNNKITIAVKNTFNYYNDTVYVLENYIDSVPKQIDFIVKKSNIPIDKANNSVHDIGPILGGQIQNVVGKVANTTLDSVENVVYVLNATVIYMTAVNDSFNALQVEQQAISQNISDVRERIGKTVDKCRPDCTFSSDGLTMDANFSSIPDFSEPMKTVKDFLNSGIESTIAKARKTLQDIPGTVTNQTRKTASDIQDELLNIKQKINEMGSRISIDDSLQTVKKYFNTSNEFVDKNQQNVQRYDYYRWIVGICLCCIVLLVVVCNLFGLFCGPCGHREKVDPTERSCLSNSGGNFFMAGTGFSFLFAWLLMLVVGVLFIVGGNSYTLVCKPWSNKQLFTFLDTQVNLSETLNISNVNISSIYSDCQKDYSLWKTLNLKDKFNLDEYLNISQYTSDVKSTIEKTKIDITNIKFLSDSQKEKARNASNSGINELNFTHISQEMKKNITKTNLKSFTASLRTFADSVTNASIKEELRREADDLDAIQSSINTKLQPEIVKLNTSITNLKQISANLSESMNKALASTDNAQVFMDTKIADIVKNETNNFLDALLKYFQSYVDWAKLMITQNVGQCGPVAASFNVAQTVLCNYIVDSLNAFWFSLGWCTMFLIPSIILSVKLAKYYRRMKSSDVFEDPNDHLEMTSTSQQYLIPRVTAKA